jgi:hypothetical protein
VLGQNGVLLRADLASKKVEPFRFARYVADIFVAGSNEVLVLAGEKIDSLDWTILRGNKDSWVEVAKLRIAPPLETKQREIESEVIGVSVHKDRLLVLARSAVYLQDEGSKWKRVPLKKPGQIGLQTPFATTDDGFVYVGLNHGEWGGGLWRIDLADGGFEVVEKKTQGEICQLPLDSKCDPVTAVVSDPADPQSVLAAVGLRHFSESGRVLKVKQKDVSVVFNKPYAYDMERAKTLPENPCDGANETRQIGWESEGVFGMQVAGNRLWLVTGRAVYELSGTNLESCAPLPEKLDDIDGLFVSEAVSGVVLVGTNINQAKSISGTTPLIAVRR